MALLNSCSQATHLSNGSNHTLPRPRVQRAPNVCVIEYCSACTRLIEKLKVITEGVKNKLLTEGAKK